MRVKFRTTSCKVKETCECGREYWREVKEPKENCPSCKREEIIRQWLQAIEDRKFEREMEG